eukprot:g39.t1
MSTPTPPSGIFDRNKRNQRRAFHARQDVYWNYGRLLHEAETSHLSLERLLHVTRLALTYFTDILRPSEEFEDVPVHYLGSHLLSHRNLDSKTNGLEERVLVQEICSFDEKEAPRERVYPGSSVAKLAISINPESYTTRENLLSMSALVKVELNGEGRVNFMRHGEEYTFNFPKLVFHDPVSEACSLSLKGRVEVHCPGTGLSAVLTLSSDGGAKGSIKQLAGGGSVNICTLSGHWTEQIVATNSEKGTKGVLFAAENIKPSISTNIDLSNITGRRLHRVWTTLHDSLIYIDSSNSKSKAGDRLCTSLSEWMKNLMPESVVTTPATIGNVESQSDTEEDSDNGHADHRSVPPCIKEARRTGKKAKYMLGCCLIALDHDEIKTVTNYVPQTAAQSLTEYWQKQNTDVTD